MYIDLKEETGTVITNGLPEVKSFDWFNQQYVNTEKQKAESYPAVYFEILDPQNWQDGSNGLQVATMRIKLHCVVFNLKDEPNAVMELTQKIYLLFQGKALYVDPIQLTSKMSRVSSEFMKRYNQLKVMTLTFEFSYFDNSAEPVLVAVSPVSFVINT